MSHFSSSLFRELSENELKSLMSLHFPHDALKGYSLCHGGLFNTTYRVDFEDAFLAGYGITREELEVRERKIKRTSAALIYFLIEAYVWHAQYNNEQNAKNGKRASFEKVELLEQL